MSRIVAIDGKKVVDANYKMAVTVDKADIAKGKKKEPNSCAVALACVRQLDAMSARVHLTRTYVEFPKRWLRFRTPISVRNNLVAFDQGGQFLPDTYYLLPLAKSERLGTPVKRNAAGKKQKRTKQHRATDVRSMAGLHREFQHKK